MKRILLLTILLFAIKSFGQQEENSYLKSAKTDFEKLSADYETKEKEVKTGQTELNELLEKVKNDPKSKYSEELTKKVKEVEEQKKDLNSFCSKYESYKAFYLDKGVTIGQINEFFKCECIVNNEQEVSPKKEYKTYLYYGDDMVVKEFPKTNDENFDQIIQKILSAKSESYLGDIIIPKENQEFKFYIHKEKWGEYNSSFPTLKTNPKENGSFIQLEKEFKFKSVAFEICDGFIADVKILILDENGNEHLFENRSSISFLNFSNSAPSNFISYKHPVNQSQIVNFDEFHNLRIRLSDVLVYIPKPGYNYIPNDVTFTFPTKDKNGDALNKTNPVKYEIKETTTLQNVIELRAYTDFLALFNDSANGLVQLQGKGDFYIFPFRTCPLGTDLRLMDKISPYVNFSRLDADVRGVETTFDSSLNKYTINNSTDLLQKAYLEMGSKLNLFNWRFAKSVPFRFIGYFPFRYQIADVKISDQLKNVQGLGLGIGFTFEFKRFNNFGFNYSLEFSKYSFIDYNTIPELELPSAYSVFRNEAEVYYHPDSDKKQAIFLRLKTFNNYTNHEAFYQLQFGYRFSIGISEVKAKAQ
ncbi:hypothetical protein JI750_17545 [Flavobacterium sp. GN10]|uniref:Outer membrane protein beta-barrel domain-containing protein n=1 Tax=Flavobacterium tagetis TaxID=2801336 RepID=A0ABS1KH11_9FLAO|nr:hypothetical protein [Flavobacterium tagetis]MBL0738705.1 hypothetical protein [Flavobacterium tagetis]